MTDLSGKIASVTVGSRGIGAAIAKRFAKDGADVAITYNSSPDKAEEVIKTMEKYGSKTFALKLDAGQPESAADAVKEVVEKFGRIDILVNNAGTGFEGKIGETADLARFDEINTINVRTLYALTYAAVPHIPSGGRIINISSVLGERAIFKDIGIYNASKFAVTGLTRSWAHDLGEKNILVNAIQPGPIDTDLNPADGSDMAEITALKRYGHVDEVAALAAFLASDESSYITGATINVDGGTNA